MGISFKTLAAFAAVHAVATLSDDKLDTSMTATVEAKGLEALATLKAESKAEEALFLATPAGVRKALIAKRAGQARLAIAGTLASMSGRTSTVQARRGLNQTEGKGENRQELTPARITNELEALLIQPGAMKESMNVYDPANKGAKSAPGPLLALRTLQAALKAHALLNRYQAEASTASKTMAKAA